MAQVKTIKIENADYKGGFIRINEADFDSATDKRFVEKIVSTKEDKSPK